MTKATLTERAAATPGVLEAIGGTPLVPIRRITAHLPEVTILAKAEWLNPGGSVKDRPALAMVEAGLASGALAEGRTVLEATSGNTGIALAMIAAALGFPATICLPKNASAERKRLLTVYGAEILETSPLEGTDGAIRRARRLAEERPDLYFYPDQYANEANWRAHYRGTAEEIWSQTCGRIDHFICGLGTSGTFMGTGRRLRELSPRIVCTEVQPQEPMHGIEGWKHMETSLVPAIYDPAFADDAVTVGSVEARAMARRLAREEGLFVGVSAGAAMASALALAERVRRGVIVTVFPDSGSRYGSEGPFDDD